MARPDTLVKSLPGLWRTSRYFWPHMRKSSFLAAGGLFALIGETLFRLLEPWPLKFIFDHITGADSLPIPYVSGLEPMLMIAILAFSIVVIIGMRAIAAYFATVSFALVGNRVLTAVRNDVFQHLQRLPLSFHSKARGGDLTIRVVSDVGILKEVAVTALLPLAGSLLVLFGIVGVMFWLNWELALISLAIVPLFWLTTARLSKRIQHVARKQRKQESKLATTAAESMTAIATVQALSLEENFSKAFSAQNKVDLKQGVKAKRLQARLERTVDILFAVSTALVLCYGARLVLSNALTPGDLLVFVLYLRYAFKPQRDFAKYTARLAKASAAGERILDILQRKPEVRDLPGAVTAPAFTGHIVFDNVGFRYETARGVLANVSFEVLPGQQVALVGPSGGGKTTLLGLLLRLYDPTSGRVLVDGRDIRDYKIASLRTQISVVLQDGLLFAASLRDNISCGNPEAGDRDIRSAARLANAHDFIMSMPNAYNTDLAERGITLSVGQRQRIAIARAAVRKTPILILDEPTSSLDEENQGKVLEALERLRQGRTTLVATHDLQLAARADLILYIDDRGVAERGTHEELMRLSGRYAVLYRLQLFEEKSHALSGR
ncbi:MAG: ABC transporter ATP-binding protein [Dehalococcoidia bacterium]|nr:ABC transporter ATP-binding protein [Dehalococcoidia bacterium]